MGNCCVLKSFGICEVEHFSVVQEAGSIPEFTMQPLVTAIYQYTHEFQHTQCLGATVLIPTYGYKEGTGLKQENSFCIWVRTISVGIQELWGGIAPHQARVSQFTMWVNSEGAVSTVRFSKRDTMKIHTFPFGTIVFVYYFFKKKQLSV